MEFLCINLFAFRYHLLSLRLNLFRKLSFVLTFNSINGRDRMKQKRSWLACVNWPWGQNLSGNEATLANKHVLTTIFKKPSKEQCIITIAMQEASAASDGTLGVQGVSWERVIWFYLNGSSAFTIIAFHGNSTLNTNNCPSISRGDFFVPEIWDQTRVIRPGLDPGICKTTARGALRQYAVGVPLL